MKRSMRAFSAALFAAMPLLACSPDTSVRTAREATLRAHPQAGRLSGFRGVFAGWFRGVLNILGCSAANGSETSAWIGSGGGTLKTAAYTLTVPKGAVSSNTLFELEPANDGTYKVQLTATRNGLLGTINVGAQGFRK